MPTDFPYYKPKSRLVKNYPSKRKFPNHVPNNFPNPTPKTFPKIAFMFSRFAYLNANRHSDFAPHLFDNIT